ncbi:hypothetical protein [Streptococcus thoraltensis]|uniref:hypothetical protein n=1 Tax=Streptococcus thoraltensis TaxID=55085 RepID=UPI001F59AF38|nr:hypothetical protein [Streptococcus thoraltensis]
MNIDYKRIHLDRNFELNLWVLLYFSNPKSVVLEEDIFWRLYVKLKKGKVLHGNLRFRKWLLKSSKTTFDEIDVILSSLSTLSTYDLKILLMLIENGQVEDLFSEAKKFVNSVVSKASRILLILIPIFLSYEVVFQSLISWVNTKNLFNTFRLITYISFAYIYYVLYVDLLLHNSKKKEVKRYLPRLIYQVLEQRD